MSRETFDLTCDQVTCNDTAGTAIHLHNVQHFVAGIHLYFVQTDHTAQSRVSTQQQLLSGLTAGIERTRYLSTTERTVIQQTTVFASERNTLCYALVDNRVGNFSQTINVCFAGTIVTTFDCIVEQTVNRVTIILIILCSIDTTLCSD